MEEKLVNPITSMVSIEIVFRQCGEGNFLRIFYGKISLEIVWGIFMEKKSQNASQSPC